MQLKKSELKTLLNETCVQLFGCNLSEASEKQAYKSVCTVLRGILTKENKNFRDEVAKKEQKEVYYMSMEFLVGTSLRNNLYNLGLIPTFSDVLSESGFSLERLYELDPDAGLGNGGLGRLASCYMDSMSGLGMPATGFSIRYEFGIFKQKIIDGWQVEFPDNWLEMGEVWLQPRDDENYEVRLGGKVNEWTDENGCYKCEHVDYQTILAVPYDMYISGYDSKAVNKLVLWSAHIPTFDMRAFSRGEYLRSLEQNTMAEVISKVLYPADNHIEGKKLRLKQQYLLVSASLQSILAKHLKKYGTLDNLADKAAIHINDTHPALCVPELMRLLMDDHGYGWDEAWDITTKTLSYTNHTVMSEALERWSEGLVAELFPRIYMIIKEVNRRLVEKLNRVYPGDLAKIEYMSPVACGEVRMANLCLACCHSINGVSKLHTDILKNSIFHDYYDLDPDRFVNVTNGIAYRRWLGQANPRLTALLSDTIGDSFLRRATDLERLMKYKDDPRTLEALRKIKRQNKVDLAAYISEANGINVDPDSLFDVQIKRLHEYKRQLLNVLQILAMYNDIHENPNADFVPRTFLFGAKASAGYDLAKQIISLIVAVSNMVDSDPLVRDKMKVVFLEDYKVSLAERIIPAADISEQISIAGKEASGTGNMKLMINGAVTLGTLDGANVEISEAVGPDNIFIFGMNTDDVQALWNRGYRPQEFIDADPELKAVISMLTSGVLGRRFDDIAASLLTTKYGAADQYMTIADFAAYRKAQKLVSKSFAAKDDFTKKSLVNIARAGIFSADRSVEEYADKIWHL